MRIKRHNHGGSARVCGMVRGRQDYGLMAKVNAIENSDREKDWAGHISQFRDSG